MLFQIWEIVLLFLGAVATGGGGAWAVVIFRSRAQRRKDNASAKESELNLVKLEKEIEELLDESEKKQMRVLINELNTLRKQSNEFFAEKDEWMQEKANLMRRLMNAEGKILELTRELVLTRKSRDNSRCDKYDCCYRQPPFEKLVEQPI